MAKKVKASTHKKKTTASVKSKSKVQAKAKKPAAKTSSKAKTVAKKVFKTLAGKTKSVKSAKPLSSKKPSSNTHFIPMGDRVLVAQNDGFSQTNGGIFIPSAYQEKPLQGRVLQVGPGFKNKKGQVRPLDVRVGDEVLFDKYAGTTVQMEGQNYLLLSEKEIIGVVTKA